MDAKDINKINADVLNSFIDKNLANQIKNDPELMNNKDINIDQLIIDASEMSRAIQLQEVNTTKILDAIGESIIIEEMQEDGSIIKKYESIIPNSEGGFNYDRGRDHTIQDMLKKVRDLEHSEYIIEEVDRIDSFNRRYSGNVDLFLNFGPDGQIEVPKLDSNFLDDQTMELIDNGFDENQTIIVNDENEKEGILEYVDNQLQNGKFNLIKFNKPLSISGLRIHRKLKSIKQKFYDTYGSEVLRKISEMILREENLYQNLDRIKRIEQFNKNKIKLEKKYRLKSKIRSIIGVK